MFYIYKVLIGRKVLALDRPLSYYYEDDSIKKGMRVLVDLKNSKDVISLVIDDPILIESSIEEYEKENSIKLSKIKKRVDDVSLLSDKQFELAYQIKEYYKCSLLSIVDCFLPPALKANKSSVNKATKATTITYIEINKDINCDLSMLNKNEQALFNKIKTNNELTLSKVTAKKALDSLLNKKILVKVEKTLAEVHSLESGKLIDFDLTSAQQNSFDYILNSDKKVTLLHGVTGSGKTAIYIKLIDYYLKLDKSVIILIPEISLTSQNAGILLKHYKDELVILNSSVSSGLKYENYLDILNDKKRVILGTRSAIFAPVKNLGLIIIDEEHSSTYKQDKIPFYDARTISTMLANNTGCKVVFASATPSLVTMAKASREVYGYTKLTAPFSKIVNRDIKIVDMNDLKNFDPYTSNIISKTLKNEIIKAVTKKEQVLVLINRRGYSPLVMCTSCNKVAKCPNCDVPLVYHKKTGLLKCHHCNYQISKAEYKCQCGNTDLLEVGYGTERISQELKALFPNYKITQLDSDISSKKVRDETLELFSTGDIDILVGTSLLSKGHDFENVTLASIVDIDSSLTLPSYKAGEDTFDLLSQFVGRTGRGKKKATVLIQTMVKENLIINLALKQDYDSFYKYEMNERKKYKYPPYTYLTMIYISSYDLKQLLNKTNQLRLFLANACLNKRIDVLGPITPYIPHINNKFSRQFLLKYKCYDDISSILDDLNNIKMNEKEVDISINVDPVYEL